MLDWLQHEPENFRRLKWTRFTKVLRDLFIFYKDTTVSMDLTIDGTEVNTAGANLTLLNKLATGSNTVGLVAQNDRTRELKRNFKTFDTFESLAIGMKGSICQIAPTQPNYVYPSTGLLRVDNLVDQFLKANQWGNLSAADKAYTTAQMADTMTFTTKWTGNLDPSTAADPTIGRWIPTSASLKFDNTRQDLHTIIMLISLSPDKKGLPSFDDYGRILSPGAAGVREAAAASLDRQRDRNAQVALTRLGTGIGRFNNFP